MRFLTSSKTSSRAFDYYTKRPFEIIQLTTVLKSRTDVTGALRPGVRYYLPDNKEIFSRITIGLISFPTVNNPVTGAPEGPDIYPYPAGSLTAESLGLDLYLTLTLCDKNGSILFNRIPVRSLANTLRKFRPYSGRICTFKSYFQLTNAPVINTADPIVCNIGFYLL
jgi:hypothetical protein